MSKKLKKLKKLMIMLLLSPILPVTCIPEGDTGESNNNNDGDAGNDDSTGEGKDGDNDVNVNDNKNDSRVIFNSQDDFDRVISNRINKAIKTKQAEWDNQRRKEQMTETERLKAEKTEAETKANLAIENANKMLLKADVLSNCAELNIIDPDAAFALMDRENIEITDGKVTGSKEALKNLIETKPWLVKNNNNVKPSGDDQNNNPNNNKTTNVNSLLRKMAGY